ncbi:hypothetical protein [Natronomonas sp. EA1]|uniref:hypothetical protein n=1 Tax=Natronomonas sp. EA1 TaxID=3421655 RepID=UPI003EBE3BD4
MQQTLTKPRTAPETAPETTPDPTTDERPRAGARPTTPKTDPWASETEEQFTSDRAPRTFDPFCTRQITTLIEKQAETPE